MGAEISYQAVYSNQETFSFNKLPSSVKLLIFTLLPYQDVVNCMLLNKAYYSFVLSNWKLMRKVSVNYLSLSTDYDYDNEEKQKCCIDIARNYIVFEPNRAYASYGSCKNLLQFFESKNDFRRTAIKWFMDVPGIRNFRKKPRKRRPNLPISSIEKGAEKYLDFLLSRVNPQCISLNRYYEKATYDVTKIFPLLKNSISKHGTKASEMKIHKININSTILDIINLSGASTLKIAFCDFDDETILSQISNMEQIYIDTNKTYFSKIDWDKREYKCDFVKMLQLFIENWMNGKYPKQTTLTLDMPEDQGENLYSQVVKDKFDFITCANTPDQANEMIYRRSDGWKLRLMYNSRFQYKYLFKTS